MSESLSLSQIILLDCCYAGAFKRLLARQAGPARSGAAAGRDGEKPGVVGPDAMVVLDEAADIIELNSGRERFFAYAALV